MHAVGTLVPEPFHEEILNLWMDIKQTFGFTGKQPPYFYFSYQEANCYEFVKLGKYLTCISRTLEPFTIHAHGLGIFPGERLNFYIPIVKNHHLVHIQQRMWLQTARMRTGENLTSHPNQWIPYIPLVFDDVTYDPVDEVVRYLQNTHLHWEIPIEQLTLFHDDGDRSKVHSIYSFS